MVWSHNDSWMVTGDHAGYVKYWQSNMNNVKMFQAHKEALRGIRYLQLDSVLFVFVYIYISNLINATFPSLFSVIVVLKNKININKGAKSNYLYSIYMAVTSNNDREIFSFY